jgi:hypothetical protein
VFTLAWESARAMPLPPSEAIGKWLSLEGEVATTFHRTARGYLVRFPGIADFAIDFAARTVVCSPDPEADAATLESVYENQVVPLLRTWQGDLVLHASGVVIEDLAVGFCGLSRRGKSTLAGAFARAGHACVTDDGLVLVRAAGGLMVEPKVSPLRLLPDSEAALLGSASTRPGQDAKARVGLADKVAFQQGAVPLGPLYHLGEPRAARLTIAPLARAAAFDLLLKQTFMLDTGDKAQMQAHFERVAFLVETVPIFALDYPRDYAQLPQVVAAIAAHVRANREQS